MVKISRIVVYVHRNCNFVLCVFPTSQHAPFFSLPQLYDHTHRAEIELFNSGKVDLDYEVLGASSGLELTPGQPSVSPEVVRCEGDDFVRYSSTCIQ